MQSSSRNGAKVIWLAVHTTEGMMRAKDLRDWKSWAGSSHASNDETGVLMTPADGFVPYDRAAWTLRNGNPISENIEQCGWARWTRAEWLSREKLLNTTALWLADRSRARGIPLVHLSDADIRAKRPGVIGHGDYSRATGDGTHTDPGKGYPWDVVLDKARWLLNPTPLPEADMPLNRDDENVIYRAVTNVLLDVTSGASSASDDLAGYLAAAVSPQIAALQGRVDGLSEALRQVAAGSGKAIDLAAVQAAAKAGAADAIKAIDVTVRAEPS